MNTMHYAIDTFSCLNLIHFNKMSEMSTCSTSALGSCMPSQRPECLHNDQNAFTTIENLQPHNELIRYIGSSRGYQECKQIQATKNIYCFKSLMDKSALTKRYFR